jgi:hypothetical protein
MEVREKKKLERFLILLILGLIAVNLPLISALIINVYAKVTLSPGEQYTLNIPFVGLSKNPLICGVAEKTDGTLVKGVKVSASSGSILVQNTTNSDGEYCLTLPEINKTTPYNISVEYDNSTLTLGSNGYDFDFPGKIFRKGTDNKAYLIGRIVNEDAEVENGRFEVKMGHKVNGTWKYLSGDYQKFLINIEPNEIYEIPSEELDFSYDLADLEVGEYKFLIKTSFNGKEYSGTGTSVFFNITS